MLDIGFIRDNLEKVKQAAKDKNRPVDFDRLLELDEERRKLIGKIDDLRSERNKLEEKAKKAEERTEENLALGRKLREEIQKLEQLLGGLLKELNLLLSAVPNVPLPEVPTGNDSKSNKVVKVWGEIPEFDFKLKDHLELAISLNLVDFERGVKTGGFRSYFLKNEMALMEMGILLYTFKLLAGKGYTPLIAPALVKEFCVFGVGQLPWGKEEVYYLEKDELYLSGTAEVPVTSYYSNEILKEESLPQKLVAFSPCFRREAGSYGKDTKGLYRLHQFNKIEQVIIAKNDLAEAKKLHQELLENAEEILQALKLPYRVVLMCTGEMGEPQMKKYDIETWMPVREGYGETMSNSLMGDFQAKRLGIRYRDKNGRINFCYTLNNTAVASPRILIAVLENYQTRDGGIIVPEILKPYVGKDKITP